MAYIKTIVSLAQFDAKFNLLCVDANFTQIISRTQ